MDEAAAEGCIDRFEAAIGEAYEESPLFSYQILPTAGSWEAGDRGVICAVFNGDFSKLTTDVLS